MPKHDKIKFSKIKTNIFVFGALNCFVYIILFLSLRYFNLLHYSGLRMLNYVTFFLLSLYQIKRWVKQIGTYIPSLQSFAVVFFTGAISFLFLTCFIFLFSLFDPYITELYFNIYGKLSSSFSFLIFLEGLGASIIIAMIAMMYSDRYKDGEAKI